MAQTDTKIHALMVCKNEGDVVAYTLRKALTWADAIYVMDNGSSDDSWAQVQEVAAEDARVVPWKVDDRPFSDCIRSRVFNEFRERSRDGDWWCRLDADEEYVDDPREFLAKIPRRFHVVWANFIEFFVTWRDVDELAFDRPIAEIVQQLRHYQTSNSEHRFLRYRHRLDWPEDAPWPRHMGIPYTEKITLKHYKYRSPDQIRRRMATRQEAIGGGLIDPAHWRGDWEQKLLSDEGELRLCEDGENYIIDSDCHPPHLDPPVRHLIKRLMHGLKIWP